MIDSVEHKKARLLVLLTLVAAVGCAIQQRARQETLSSTPTPQTTGGSIKLTSSAFKDGEQIPRQYTCDGVNVSPPLEWSGVPKSAKTVAIIAEDPDAPSGTWVHWVVYNLPADNIGMVENLPSTENLKS